MADSNQVRINELARELEIKAKVLIEYLPEAGVTEKKTHSSSIDLVHAERVRKHFRDLAAAEEAAEAEKNAKTTAAKKPAPKPTSVPAAAPVTSAPPRRGEARPPHFDCCAGHCGATRSRSVYGSRATNRAPNRAGASSRARCFRRLSCPRCRSARWHAAAAGCSGSCGLICYDSDIPAHWSAQHIYAAIGSALASLDARRSAPNWLSSFYTTIPARYTSALWPRPASWCPSGHAPGGSAPILSPCRRAPGSSRWRTRSRRQARRPAIPFSAAPRR